MRFLPGKDRIGMWGFALLGAFIINLWILGIYLWLGRGSAYEFEQQDRAFAENWLRLADQGQSARYQLAARPPGIWFRRFIRDRQSLGKLKKRVFIGRKLLADGLQLRFKSDFEHLTEVNEIVLVLETTNGLFVREATFIPERIPFLAGGKDYTGRELEMIRALTQFYCGKFDFGDFCFYEYLSRHKFGMLHNRYLRRLTRQRAARGRPLNRDYLRRVKQWQGIPGRTLWEFIAVYNAVFYQCDNQMMESDEYLLFRKDKYSERPRWQLERFQQGELRPRD